MKLQGIFRTSAILAIVAVTAAGTCQLASAAPTAVSSVSATTAATVVAVIPQPTAADRALAAKIRAVPRGTTIVIPATFKRPSLTVSKSAAGVVSLSANVPRPKLSVVNGTAGFCTYFATAALLALGAAALAILAFSGAGIIISGVFVSAQILNAAALSMSAGASMYAFVGRFIC